MLTGPALDKVLLSCLSTLRECRATAEHWCRAQCRVSAEPVQGQCRVSCKVSAVFFLHVFHAFPARAGDLITA